MVQSLHEISTKALMQRIADELEGLIVADAEGRYAYVNQRWSSLTGYTFEQVKGRYVRDVVRLSRVDEVLKTQKFVSGDAILLNSQTGEEVPVYCSYTPLFHENKLEGCLVYMIRKNEDVSMAVCAARSSSTVLIDGETGSGKELVAHAIHELSPRCKNRLIKVNCAAIPAELLESEFFGYVEGAFTGASRGGRIGKFEMANGGSLFLDEINQMPLALQPKLLRVLQEREIERVGSSATIPIDTRIISSTNTPLEKLVMEEKFRSDLYFRLNVVCIHVPPLRERSEDIPLLIDWLMKQLNFRLNLQIPGISQEAVQRLMEYDWPGNVRELQNVLERAMNLAWFETLEWKYFSDYFKHHAYETKTLNSAAPPRLLRQRTDELEKDILMQVLQEFHGNKTLVAQNLGISRTILYKKLHKYQLL